MAGLVAGGCLLLLMLAGILAGGGAALFLARNGRSRAPRVALVLALGFGGLVLGSFAGVVYYSKLKRAEHDARAGWNLVPIVVAGVDIETGTELTFDMITQRSVPEQFVSAAMVRPDAATLIVKRRTVVPMLAGDPVLFDFFCTER